MMVYQNHKKEKKMRNLLIAVVFGVVLSGAAFAEVINFRIPAGTRNAPWNSEETMVEAKVGDVVRIFNDDSVDHQLHTFGAPCNHGPRIAPGASWDCEVREAFDPETDGSVYDHGFGSQAKFWIRSTK
jgi:hypothetical protein